MANSVDIVKIRQRQRRRQQIINMLKLLCVLAVIGVCIFIYIKRDIWFPQLEGIGSRYQNITQNENADTEGNYPLSVSGGVDYYASFVSNHMFILCDMYVYVYNTDGSIKDSRQHAYSNAVMETNGSRCLLYSCNGTKLRVDTANKMLYESTMTNPILFARIGENGYVAAVTESDTYACRLNIYDTSGKLIYSRDCVDRLLDVSLSEDGCIFTTLGAENGDLITTLQHVRYGEDKDEWATAPLSTLCMKVYMLSDGGAFVIGDTKAAYYSNTGALLSSYDYNGTLIDYAFHDDRAAILLKNEERRQSQLLLFSDPSAQPAEVGVGSIARSITIDGEKVFLLGAQSIESYAFSGDQMSSLDVADSYDKLLKNGKYFYLLGYDKINRINAKGS